MAVAVRIGGGQGPQVLKCGFEFATDQPRPMDDGQLDGMVVDALRHAGADPAYIHAYKRTGVLITTDNFKRWRKRELEEFREALEEWERLWERRN